MSWWALAPTIALTLVLAVVVLVQPRKAAQVDPTQQSDEATISTPLPTVSAGIGEIGSWLSNSRRPVWPIDYGDLKARLRRGVKVAAGLAIVLAMLAVSAEPGVNSIGGVLSLIAGLFLGAIFIAFASIASVIHTGILQVLPWRGAIASTALGAALGLAVAYAPLDKPKPHVAALVMSGVVYGLITGMLYVPVPHKSGTGRTRRSRTRKDLSASR